MKEQIEDEKRYNQQKNSLYNMVIHLDSMNQLTHEGWKVEINPKAEIKDYSTKNVSIVSVLGNKNTGKSFLLHLLTGKDIPNGFTVTTEGLSFIIPDDDMNKDDNFILIDTAGTESPLLDKSKKEDINENAEQIKKEEEEEKISIENIAKDRQITDYFIQKFILEKSDIFICVVDNLTLTDQKFINRIIKYYANKKIFIVHNLKTFVQKSQVEEYIEDTLLQSLTFNLEKVQYYGLDKTNKEKKDQNEFYFKQKLKEKDRIIIHLILANNKSEAGKFYNDFTMDYINGQLRQVKEKKPFDIIKNLKEFLKSISGDIFKDKLESEHLVEDEKVIKLNNDKLELKDCSIDELGNNIITETTYKPKYRYGFYTDKDTKQNKLFVEMELFGIWKFEKKLSTRNNDLIINIKGKKEKAIEKKIYISNNYIPGDEFDLEIKVGNEKGFLDEPILEDENGLYILTYPVKEKNREEEIIEEEGGEDEDV